MSVCWRTTCPSSPFSSVAQHCPAWCSAGLNPTHRGNALARDIRLADCQVVFTEQKCAGLLDGLDLGGASVLNLTGTQWFETVAAHRGQRPDPVGATADDLLMLIYTSGTSGDPKAVRCTHGKIAFPGRMLADRFGLSTPTPCTCRCRCSIPKGQGRAYRLLTRGGW